MVPLESETLNTFDTLIEVFDDWYSQLRAANFEQFDGLPDKIQEETETFCVAPHQDIEPGGMP